MGRDIFDFTGSPPAERLGLPPRPDPAAPASTFRPEDLEPGAPDQETSGRRGLGVVYLLVTLAGLAAVGAGGYWYWSTSGRPDLVVGDQPIANAEEVLADAETLLRRTTELDGAPLDDDARCFFAPGNSAPQVVCGPVWLGVSPDSEPWLLVDTRYQGDPSGSDEVVGEVIEIRDTVALEDRDLIRPDGSRPAGVGQPARSNTGPRLPSGSLLVGPDEVLSGAEAALAAALVELDDSSDGSMVSVADDSACYLRAGPELIHGVPVTDDRAWCGPARSNSSRVDEIWIAVSVRYQQGPEFGSSSFESAQANLRLSALPEGSSLTRPDGRSPTGADSLDRPPVPIDYAEVVDFPVPIEGPAEGGLLVTERYRIEFAHLARTDRVGSGAQSFTAAAGHDLIVASIAPTDQRPSPRGFIVVDGMERPMPRWNSSEEGSTLVLSVPEGSRSVEMLVENDGRPQTISLLDGSLDDGFPLALYRPDEELAQPFSVRVEMPAGEAVLVSGRLSGAEWRARDDDGQWLAEGLANLEFTFDEWAVDRPCCDVRVDDVTSTFVLVAVDPSASPPDTSTSSSTTTTDPAPSTTEPGDDEGDGGLVIYADLREDPGPPSSRSGPFFEVPEELAEMTLRVTFDITITVDEAEQVLTEELELEVSLVDLGRLGLPGLEEGS